jgi:hypothetical protein
MAENSAKTVRGIPTRRFPIGGSPGSLATLVVGPRRLPFKRMP